MSSLGSEKKKAGKHYERVAYECQMDKAQLERRVELLERENKKLRQENRHLREQLGDQHNAAGSEANEHPRAQRTERTPATW